MRYLVPALTTASPAFAHTADIPHTHSADWTMLAAFFLVSVAAVFAQRQVHRARAKARK